MITSNISDILRVLYDLYLYRGASHGVADSDTCRKDSSKRPNLANPTPTFIFDQNRLGKINSLKYSIWQIIHEEFRKNKYNIVRDCLE